MTTRSALEALFSPRSVAVIGATDRAGSVGRTVLANLCRGSFRGKVYAVNPHRTDVLGLRCYESVRSLPMSLDLAIIVTPASTVPEIIRDCVDAGVLSVIVISAGFKEHGPEGKEFERRIRTELRRGNTRLIGPNCLGIMNPCIGLNATFGDEIAKTGNVAFLSQSGALLTAILDWAAQEQVGFSAIVSTGSMLDVGWGDLISFLGDDPQTHSVLLYIESIGDARAFLSAAREVSLNKPIIAIKAGRSVAAARAASSHTGALTGDDDVIEAAFRRSGVLRVQSIADLFYMAEVLGKQPRPKGSRLTILTNAGGPGVLATDALIAGGGGLAPLPPKAIEELNRALPPQWSHGNPIDILGDADPERYARAMEIAAENPESDGLLVILAPQGMTDPAHVAERLKLVSSNKGKPLLASWMGGKAVLHARSVLANAEIPSFVYPDTAARAFNYMWRYSYNLRGIYETPAAVEIADLQGRDLAEAERLLRQIFDSGRTLLTEAESKQILNFHGIPTVQTLVASSEIEAVSCALKIGFPVVLKLHSHTLTHKTDVHGVKLNLQSEIEVQAAYRAIQASVASKAGPQHFLGVSVQSMVRNEGYELILGSSVDAQFGPIVLFGSGGRLVEVYRDRAVALPPLNTTLARRLMEQTRIFRALQGVRGHASVDIAGLENVLVRFSELIVEHPRIKEIDINPLLASSDGLLALDARIVLHSAEISEQNLPGTAIRPYPRKYISRYQMKNGNEILIRPIRPEDEMAMVKFHETLSDQSVYLRYFHAEKLDVRAAHNRLIQKCFIDYDREMALVAERCDAKPGIIGLGRLNKERWGNRGEVAILIADQYQNLGLGTQLLGRLIDVARNEGLQELEANILSENLAMCALAKHFGFVLHNSEDPSVLTGTLRL